MLTPTTALDGVSGWAVPSQAQFSALVSGQSAFTYLTANGFQWQQNGGTVRVNNVPIGIPAYWSAGGTSMEFFGDGLSLHASNYWPVLLPGPGAVAERPMA